jgi:hypothetical protein
VWKRCFTQVRGLLYKGGYTSNPALEGFFVIKKNKIE